MFTAESLDLKNYIFSFPKKLTILAANVSLFKFETGVTQFMSLVSEHKGTRNRALWDACAEPGRVRKPPRYLEGSS